MPTPSHGLDCVSTTYRTDCWHCGASIFVYQCSHESVVLFDSLGGGGWPLHQCSYWKATPPTFAGNVPAIVKMSQREQARIQRRQNPSKIQFIGANPSREPGKKITEVMRIRETPSRTQRIERLEEWNQLTRSMMKINGPHGTYFQITLADSSAEPRKTYNAIVQSNLIEPRLLQRNSLVGVTLESRKSGEFAEWFVTEIVPFGVE